MADKKNARTARAEQMRAQRERAARRQRNVISVGIVVVVVGLIGAAGWAISTAADDPETSRDVVAPRGLVDGGVDYPSDQSPSTTAPLVEVFEDFLCPVCRQFEELNGPTLKDQAARGEITLRFMPFSFLHNASTNDYSRRAMNVAVCALDEDGPEAFWAVHDALYANQPAEGGAGPDDDELIETARSAGADLADSCVRTGRFVPWIDAVKDETQTERDIGGTPTVFVDGRATRDFTPQAVQQAIRAAGER
jgi:hypothetical protein